jgi:hypothetical protein
VFLFVTVTVIHAIRKLKSRARRIKGICAAAESLHVTRQHLWAVLKDRRESKPLLTRYHDLQASQQPPTQSTKP